MSWRHTYLVLAAVMAAITIPAHVFGLRRPWPPVTTPHHHVEAPGRTARSGPFLALIAAFALAGLASYAVIANLVPLMSQRGISTGVAAIALGLGGAGQVLGRLGYRTLVRRVGVVPRTVIIMAGVAATTALLGLFTAYAALVAVAVGAGVMRGIMTLLQATAVTERWGATHYGHLSGVLSAPIMIATAVWTVPRCSAGQPAGRLRRHVRRPRRDRRGRGIGGDGHQAPSSDPHADRRGQLNAVARRWRAQVWVAIWVASQGDPSGGV